MQVTNKTIYSYALWFVGILKFSKGSSLEITIGYLFILAGFVGICWKAYRKRSLVELRIDLVLMLVSSFILYWILNQIGYFKIIIAMVVLTIVVLLKGRYLQKQA